jgi:superoxide dismutase, Cu-Zn family
MTKSIARLVCVLFFVTAAAANANANAAAKPVTVDLKNAEGQSVGTAILSEAPHGVKIKLDIKNLPPGEHSLHIHQFAKCEAPDFKSAGPHFGMHLGHGSAPAGDIPDFSLIVGSDRTAHTSVVAPFVTLGDDDHSVFSNGGTALVIHEVAAAGAAAPPRIACGVITKPE